MKVDNPKAVVERFNVCINNRDLECLASLMTEDHVFIDAGGDVCRGRESVIETWRRFFDQFPDYRNHFDLIEPDRGVVLIAGRSRCSFKPLDGPALWTAKVRDNRIAEWRVCLDTKRNRKKLNLLTPI